MGNRVWAAERDETSQKDGKLSRKSAQVSFDDEGNYLKKTADNGVVSQDFKKLNVPIQSGASLQAKAEGKAKGGAIKSASARADGCCIRGKTRA